jgi:hypothetical protein
LNDFVLFHHVLLLFCVIAVHIDKARFRGENPHGKNFEW